MALIKKLTDIADAIREKKNIPESYETTGVWYRATGIDWFPKSHYYYYQDWPSVTQIKVTIYDVQFNDACNTGCVFICSGDTQIRITYGEEYEYPYIGYVTVNSNSSKDYSIRIGGATTSSVTGAEVIAHYKIEPCDSDGNVLYETYTPAQMAEEIRELPEGPTDNELTFSGDLSYWDYDGKWDWFIEKYGDRIKTRAIYGMNHFLSFSSVKTLPFELNMTEIPTISVNMAYAFSYATELREIPKINNSLTITNLNNLFEGCHNLREIPENFGDDWNWNKYATSQNYSQYFAYHCFSLRKIPTNLLNNITTTIYKQQYGNIYYYAFPRCSCLDELVGMNITSTIWTNNMFIQPVDYCYRLKDFIFLTNEDGTAKTASWMNQVIELNKFIGFVDNQTGSKNYILNYNSGITADKEVKDDATYQALKDDPDWFTCNVNYSRYNHDSAVRTINSLPDTSEYLATVGGTNTIKFQGQSGAKTDGGAINTLTEEEIAVATAKGWTVTLV